MTVRVTGDVDPTTGWIIDYALVEAIWRDEIHAKIDHRNLNDVLEGPTTSENLAEWIAGAFQKNLPTFAQVSEVFARETSRFGARWTR